MPQPPTRTLRLAAPFFALGVIACPALAEPAADADAFNPQQIEQWLAELHPTAEAPPSATGSGETVLLSFSDGKSSVETAVPAFKSAGGSTVDRWWNQQAAESKLGGFAVSGAATSTGNTPGLAAARSGVLQRIAQSENQLDTRMQNLQAFAMQSSADRGAFFSTQSTSAAETGNALRTNPGNASFATGGGNTSGPGLGSTPVVNDTAGIFVSNIADVAGVEFSLGSTCSGSSSSSSCASGGSSGGFTPTAGTFVSSAPGGITLISGPASD